MTEQQNPKPAAEEWYHWANILIDRLTDCIHSYKKPPHQDVFMTESDLQQKSDRSLKLLHRVHALVDIADTPSDFVADAHVHDEQKIDGIAVLFREALEALPDLSDDMQKLHKSPWLKKFPTTISKKIFVGEKDEGEGLGSGHPEHGRLPGILASLLEREQMGDTRHPREALLRHGEPRRNDAEGRQRWSAQNSRFLRTAGRVE